MLLAFDVSHDILLMSQLIMQASRAQSLEPKRASRRRITELPMSPPQDRQPTYTSLQRYPP